MLVFRVVGAVLVCVSSALIGYYLSLRDDFRAADLREFKRALNILKSEIEFAVNVLPVAFENIASKTKGEISQFFKAAADRLNKNDGAGIAQVWQECVQTYFGKSNLFEQDREQTAQLGQTLGCLDTDLQLRGIDILTEYTDKAIGEAETASVKNKRMLRSLGFIGGLVVVAVLF